MAFRKKFAPRRKFCRFCADKDLPLDYKRPDILRDFITERGKIVARRITGLCARHQRQLTRPPDGPAVLYHGAFQRREEKDHHLSGKENRYENYSSRRCGKSRPPG